MLRTCRTPWIASGLTIWHRYFVATKSNKERHHVPPKFPTRTSNPHGQKPLMKPGLQSIKTVCLAFAYNVLSITMLAVNRCSSIVRFAAPMLVLKLPMFQRCSRASENQKCKSLLHNADVCEGPQICCDPGLRRLSQEVEERFAKRMGFRHLAE